MKTIMLDMDNVITDGVFKEYIEEFYKIKIDLSKITEYNYVQKLTSKDSKRFWKFVENKNFYLDAPLFVDCYEVLEKLNRKYDLYIVTSYLWNEDIDISGNNLKNKYNYLKEMFPFIGPEKYIFTTNKKLMNFDIRIDDRLNNLSGAKIKLLFTAWHNKEISKEDLEKENIIRVNSWAEIESILI